jgi:hypothetical protein
MKRFAVVLSVAAVVTFSSGCGSHTEPASTTTAIRQMPAGKEFSGFLSDYSKLKANPEFENTVSYVRDDPAKNIHKYVAIIVEPVVVYVATNADIKGVSERGRAALADYFQVAMTNAVQDAFPVVKEPGPLVLRLRSALIGVDIGTGGGQQAGEGALERPINIGKVGVEMELVDSETGEQIAAAVDRQNLGDGVSIESASFSSEEKYRAAVEAFDGWAERLRAFLDSASELSGPDRDKADKSYKPYGPGDTLASTTK